MHAITFRGYHVFSPQVGSLAFNWLQKRYLKKLKKQKNFFLNTHLGMAEYLCPNVDMSDMAVQKKDMAVEMQSRSHFW